MNTSENNELTLIRFNSLIRELAQGRLSRNTFQRWEVELLLDIETCNLSSTRRWDILHRYQKAVWSQMGSGSLNRASGPLKLSEFLQSQGRAGPPPASDSSTAH